MWKDDLARRKFSPVHPGVVLAEDFLRPMKISRKRLADGVRLSPWQIKEIVEGRRAITADTATRLGKYFGVDARFWINLQSLYEPDVARDTATGL